MIVAAALLVVLATDGEAWTRVDTTDGITIESRPFKGSPIVELRLMTTTSASPERLCAEVFGKGKVDPDEPTVFSRKILEETADERLTYEQLSAPFISNRDYAVRAVRRRLEGGACELRFFAANDHAPASPPGYVRMEKISGLWSFEPMADGKTKLTYIIHSDPAGAIPPFLVEGTRRKVAIEWVKNMVRRAAKSRP